MTAVNARLKLLINRSAALYGLGKNLDSRRRVIQHKTVGSGRGAILKSTVYKCNRAVYSKQASSARRDQFSLTECRTFAPTLYICPGRITLTITGGSHIQGGGNVWSRTYMRSCLEDRPPSQSAVSSLIISSLCSPPGRHFSHLSSLLLLLQ